MNGKTICVLLASAAFLSAAFGEETEREKLIAELVQKGERLSAEGDKRAAYWAFTYANLYSPHDRTISAKAEALESALGRVENQEEMNRTLEAARWVPSSAFRDWPQPDPKLDAVELKMIQNQRLTGEEWRSKRIRGSEGTLFFFLSRPQMSFSEVRKDYGEPRGEKIEGNNWKTWTYSRLRLIGKEDEIFYIVWAPPGDVSAR